MHKTADVVLPADIGLPDRLNMVFRGTAVTGGAGAALITATGAATEIGRVQQLLGAVRPPETPIQRQLGDVERELVIINGLICAAVFGLGLLRGQGLLPMLRSAISLAVAAIPEGLPAVATTTLALGVQDMRRRNVLVRKLEAVETLGAIEVIGLDKTGTLTENRMATVAFEVGESLRHDGGRLTNGKTAADDPTRAVVRRLLEVAALCSEAVVRVAPDGLSADGTPTESALVEAALACGVDVIALRASAPLLATVGRGDGRIARSTRRRTRAGSSASRAIRSKSWRAARCVGSPTGLNRSTRKQVPPCSRPMIAWPGKLCACWALRSGKRGAIPAMKATSPGSVLPGSPTRSGRASCLR